MRRALLIQWDEAPAERAEAIERRLVTAFGLLVEAHELLQQVTLAFPAERLEAARDWLERYETEFPDVPDAAGESPLEN